MVQSLPCSLDFSNWLGFYTSCHTKPWMDSYLVMLGDHCCMQTQLYVDNPPILMACPSHTSIAYLRELDLHFLSNHLFGDGRLYSSWVEFPNLWANLSKKYMWTLNICLKLWPLVIHAIGYLTMGLFLISILRKNLWWQCHLNHMMTTWGYYSHILAADGIIKIMYIITIYQRNPNSNNYGKNKLSLWKKMLMLIYKKTSLISF